MLVDIRNLNDLEKMSAVTAICNLNNKDTLQIRKIIRDTTIHCSHACLSTKESIDSNNWQIKNFNYGRLKPLEDLGYLSIIECAIGTESNADDIIKAIRKTMVLGFKNYEKGIQILLLYKSTKENFLKYYKPSSSVVYGKYLNYKFDLEE